MVTMLLGGLWHGANWTFVVWGGLHGFYLWVEKFFRDKFSKKNIPADQGVAVAGITAGNTSLAFIYALFTFFLINVTWVFFRLQHLSKHGRCSPPCLEWPVMPSLH